MIAVDDVVAILVTRGDCDLSSILKSLIFPRRIIWDNSTKEADMGAFGRYLACAQIDAGPVCYFQDDDCIVEPEDQARLVEEYQPGVLTVLMPESRTDYTDTVLIGWGSICDSVLPWEAFVRWRRAGHDLFSREFQVVGCDFVFPMLSRTRRLDAEHTDLPHAHAPNRTWGSWPGYAGVKDRYLREARQIKGFRG